MLNALAEKRPVTYRWVWRLLLPVAVVLLGTAGYGLRQVVMARQQAVSLDSAIAATIEELPAPAAGGPAEAPYDPESLTLRGGPPRAPELPPGVTAAPVVERFGSAERYLEEAVTLDGSDLEPTHEPDAVPRAPRVTLPAVPAEAQSEAVSLKLLELQQERERLRWEFWKAVVTACGPGLIGVLVSIVGWKSRPPQP